MPPRMSKQKPSALKPKARSEGKPQNRQMGHHAHPIVSETPISINPESISISKVTPKNERQADFLSSIQHKALTFAEGPAGTGKSFITAYAALTELKEARVDKIIISRPAVQSGEDIGFLPGSVDEKMDPYLRPILDAFKKLVGPFVFQALREAGFIEIIPFGYMRGLSLERTFILLDETQNATPDQMKMVLTRIGEGSVMVCTSDPDQIDLSPKSTSSSHDTARFTNIKGIGFVRFLPEDVVRSRIVQIVLGCYAPAP